MRIERLDERRVLSSIHGMVFEDADASLRLDGGEAGLGDRVVYLDLNQDGRPGVGEPLQRTAADGSYAFEDLAPGEYVVRLFSGTTTQVQTSPRAGDVEGDRVSLEGAQFLQFAGDGAIAIDGAGRAVRVSLVDETRTEIELPGEAVDLAVLPDGRALVLIEGADGVPAAVLVDFDEGSVSEVDLGLSSETETQWAAVAIDSQGNGLLVPQAASGTLRQLQVSGGGLASSVTEFAISGDAVVIAGSRPGQLLVSQPEGGGQRVTLWDAQAAGPVDGASALLPELAEVLAFDSPSGLLLARELGGDAVVLDATASFDVVGRFASQDQPVVLDGLRQLVAGIDPASGELFIYDLVEETEIDRVAVPGGVVLGMAFSAGGQRLVTRHADGLRRVSFDRATGRRVQLDAETVLPDVRFGVQVRGEGAPPSSEGGFVFTIDEDTTLQASAPVLAGGAIDQDPDNLVVIPLSRPAAGTALVGPQGSLTYTPTDNFNGGEIFQFVLHDGHRASEPIDVLITVQAVNDPPQDLTIDVEPVGENAPAGTAVGELLIVDPDESHNYNISLSDSRFLVQGNLIILAPDAKLDFELEPRIELIVEAVDRDDSELRIEKEAAIEVTDENDAIEAILPETATVAENLAGARVADLEIVDQDENEKYSIAVVNDARFVVVDQVLRLAEGVSLNFEENEQVVVDITAGGEAGEPFSTSILVTVEDRNDPVEGVVLSGDALVPENVSGYLVGSLSPVDEDYDDSYQLSVDDPRFEIRDGELKLREGTAVRLADQQFITLQITATDNGTPPSTLTIEIVLEVIPNAAPWQNSALPSDVDGDGSVRPRDALIIINHLNGDGPGTLDFPYTGGTGGSDSFVDVNGDGLITPIDALLIINELNGRPPTLEAEVAPAGLLPEPEGEAPQRMSTTDVPNTPVPQPRRSAQSGWASVEQYRDHADALVAEPSTLDPAGDRVGEELISALATDGLRAYYRLR